MRLNINLASRKYEDVQQFYKRWGLAIAVTAVVTVALLITTVVSYTKSSRSNEHIRQLQSDIASLQDERAKAEAVSNRPENHDVTEQKNYWNHQFYRRQLSWTQLFNDLQKIMPARAFVSSVHPEITQDGRLKLSLVIKGDTHGNGLELVQKMEKSERFRGPQISAETMEKDQRSGQQLYKFEIATYYNPTGSSQARTSSKEGL